MSRVIILSFNQIKTNNIILAGGKGAALGELTYAGLPVPEGFVVAALAFQNFLSQAGLSSQISSILKKLDNQNHLSTERASDKIRGLIMAEPMPKEIVKAIELAFTKLGSESVAVRSSATVEDGAEAAWAGQLNSFLHVGRADLIDSVKKCWASLYSPRAITYRVEKKFAESDIAVAVIIQVMIPSEVSGICFTVHPVSQNHNQMVIEAGYGLGEAIVGGLITPDTYIIDKKTLNSPQTRNQSSITERNISEQTFMIDYAKSGTKQQPVSAAKQNRQKLPDEKIIELAKMCGLIESHFGCPQDIEWAWTNNRLFILQSRPITTLSKK